MGNFNKKLKAKIILGAFKQWLTSYLKPKILYTDNGGEFRNKVMISLNILITISDVLIVHNIKKQ